MPYPKLTLKELTTLVSRFQTSCYRLKQTGDYPEEYEDKVLLRKLIDMKYDAQIEEDKCLKNSEPS